MIWSMMLSLPAGVKPYWTLPRASSMSERFCERRRPAASRRRMEPMAMGRTLTPGAGGGLTPGGTPSESRMPSHDLGSGEGRVDVAPAMIAGREGSAGRLRIVRGVPAKAAAPGAERVSQPLRPLRVPRKETGALTTAAAEASAAGDAAGAILSRT